MGAGGEEDELLFTPRKQTTVSQQTILSVEGNQPLFSSSSAPVAPKVVEELEEDALIFRTRTSVPSQHFIEESKPAENIQTHSRVVISHQVPVENLEEDIANHLGFTRRSDSSELSQAPREEAAPFEGSPFGDAESPVERPFQRPERGNREDRGDRRGPPSRSGDREGGDRGPGGPRRGRDAGRTATDRPKPSIQDIFKRGQEVLVQVIKEGIGSKGPTLSTYVSIAGRYLVLMPGLDRVGISRKILDESARRRLRMVFNQLRPPKGLGFIIRTAGVDKTKTELQRDLVYLSRLWQVVARRIKKTKSPAEVYQESDMITRTIRDTFTTDIDTIWVDEKRACEHAQEFLQFVMPQQADKIKHFEDSEPLFHRYGLEEEIAKINLKKVPLPHGGSIVIEQTEALVAIDVNSGNFRTDSNNAEETAFQINMAAAKEIARQLRLRDLGGVIVNDFIDMREEKHRRMVERALRDAMSRDRARTKVLRISGFGIIEMTRQRIRPSLRRSVFQDCPFCNGISYVKTSESMSLDVIRLIQLASCRNYISNVRIRVADGVANFLLNKKRRIISELELSGNMEVEIFGAHGVASEMLEVQC
ncbi:MAG: Rne/Rng family ribonuclease, partial [Gemmataceae bacterium]|nr:Rne/Rng family ribonuclease [Gemmataceae bacterium]